ncbi:M56 family metallopeptidase [Hymenobacter weizhouensis]|uniref:M56 family metallopeptidase n=1 Tax=Hymenobacter sp. YIM 151500-1 TaxID=2987689 RepID=UPI002226342B|nr:M56 family metallopeptidase [Hymenobacter sp. YIM 151500-1]UYZ62330.1 hypothetical protein OIS53_15185 [Hymenobacter sp. YIM 151500-1]
MYYGLLRHLTFHQLNRLYLLAAVSFAALYPALDLSYLLPRPAATSALHLPLPTWAARAAVTSAAPAPTGPNHGAWLLGLYWIGVAVLLLRLLVQLASLVRLHRASRPAAAAGTEFRAVSGEVSPFSFGRSIYLNPNHHAPAELPMVLLHERVHVRQLHTLDVLLAHLHRAAAWWSPAAWLLLRAVQENLEFIADAAVLRESHMPARQYQYSLVQLSTLAPVSALASPFSFLTLKNRIRMMNSRASSPRQLLRYAAGLALLAGLAVACATPKATETPQPSSITQSQDDLQNLTYILDGKEIGRKEGEAFMFSSDSANAVEIVHVFKGNKVGQGVALEALRRDYGSKLDDGILLIVTKKNLDSEAVRSFLAKYNIAGNTSHNSSRSATSKIYEKLRQGQPLTNEEIGGRLIIIDKKEASMQQLQALPAGVVTGLALSDGPTPKYGNKAQHGVLYVMTKSDKE